jgi:hypothetical protein
MFCVSHEQKGFDFKKKNCIMLFLNTHLIVSLMVLYGTIWTSPAPIEV